MQTAVLCVCLALVALVAGQTEFSASFEYRHPLMKGGVVQGQIQYSWSTRSYRLFYPTTNYQEILKFNDLRGYDITSDKPFFNQWVYKSGRTCACETGPLNAAMGQLFIDSAIRSNFTRTATTTSINGVSCTQYNRITGTTGDVTTLYWDEANQRVCRAVYTDLRQLTFKALTPGTPASSVFSPPAGCKCGQPVDIAIVLDRSGSISQTEFKNEKDFVVGFTSKFAYGPFGANLALVHFNTPAWTTLTMTEGISDDNVNKSITALKCCTSSTNMAESCCCCGTSVSSGMRLGVDQLIQGRARTEKVLLVVTDGYHNTDIYGKGCARDSVACRKDLSDATQYALSKIPDVKIYAIGVGADRDISKDELLIIANNMSERVLTYSDFTSLAQNSLDLVARACQENLNPCGGCCGFCVCGQCSAPDSCDQTSFCSPNNISGVCCKSTPKDCVNANDKCKQYECSDSQSACVETPIACKPNTACFTYACQPTTGICSTTSLCTGQAECRSDAECSDGNKCTRDICDPLTQLCKWESNATNCNDNDLCTLDECDVSLGCINTRVNETEYCDDQSVCTVDTCDRVLGCVHTNKTCVDDNLCTDDICDPFRGCLHVPINCTNAGEDKCKLYYCVNGTCNFREADGCSPAVPIITGVVLTTAAIIGIVIGVVLCVAGVGAGGAYAYSQAAGTGNVAPVMNNPIYSGSGNQGQNPLFRGS